MTHLPSPAHELLRSCHRAAPAARRGRGRRGRAVVQGLPRAVDPGRELDAGRRRQGRREIGDRRRRHPAEVLTAVQKADIAFQMMIQVRNKLVEAFTEIKNCRFN